MLHRDIAILICSRGREAVLGRLLDDLDRAFLPALAAGNLTACVVLYAQGYGEAFLAGLETRYAARIAAGDLVIRPAARPHTRIGDVVHAGIRLMHTCVSYRLAMLMDDDSLYTPDETVDSNLRAAARVFLDGGHRAHSVKLGDGKTLAFGRFIEPEGPIMPFKEKMLWVSRPVLDAVLALPRFPELSIGEDAVIAALAWLPDPHACHAVHGLATFRHLGYEPAPDTPHDDAAGGYAELMGYTGPDPTLLHGKYDVALRTGVTPWHVMPDVFVGPEHEHFIFNGVRGEVVGRVLGPEIGKRV